jgi:AraC-like DNA-binding protein
MRFGPAGPGVERAEVRLHGSAFEPHRHDVYAVGVTTFGVQTFAYRGSRRACLPGELHVLHPDETHDGAAGTEEGFGYRILYIAPELIRDAVGQRPLPFVAEPVHRSGSAPGRVAALLADIDDPIDDVLRIELVVVVADCLTTLSNSPVPPVEKIDIAEVTAVRDHLAAHAHGPTSASTLEAIAGSDRFTIAPHFRRAFGTSPDRYRIQRRLAVARAAISQGQSLAQAAADAGFADQSHMTRQFKRTYGFPPGRWATLAGQATGEEDRP